MTFPIPNDAMYDRLAFVGSTGSGKTYAASAAVEALLARLDRVVIVDPLGVWWGLRLTADGKSSSGFDLPIFGGAHGDISITETSGAVIGEAVAGSCQSCIIDLSLIGTKAGERRFMLAFLTSLYRGNREAPLHLVIDESDMFAPQKLLDKDGDAAKLLGMMETIVRRGRVRGFTPWLITQRPAVLSKDVLSQVQGLIAMKLTAPQDRAAIGAWIDGEADRELGKRILASLPSKKVGEGVVWIPGRGVLKQVAFPRKVTFDSSRSPRRGETSMLASIQPIDIGDLKSKLATVEAEVKANDPKALKAEIERLKSAGHPQNIADIEKRCQDAYQRGRDDGYASGFKGGFDEAMASVRRSIDGIIPPQAQPQPNRLARLSDRPATTADQPELQAQLHRGGVTPPPLAKKIASPDLTGPQRRVAESLQFWKSVGNHSPSRAQVAAVAGYTPGSGTFGNILSQMSKAGLISYPSPGDVSSALGTEDPMDGLLAKTRFLGVLSGPQIKVLDAIKDGAEVFRDQIAEATGYTAGSGTFGNILSQLSTLGAISRTKPGFIVISDWAAQLMKASL